MLGRDIIVIGGSAGAISVLARIVAELPKDLAAAVFITQHIGASTRTRLPEFLASKSSLPVTFARDGEPIRAARIYVAPPDQHLVIEDGHIRLVHGPKENHTRPAIDPLFRSAGIACGPRVIGVVLSGYLDDGAAGLLTIKDRGGITIIQDPDEAYAASMPESAAAAVAIDHTLRSSEIAGVLVRYDPPTLDSPAPVAPIAEFEHKMTAMQVLLTERHELERVACPSGYVCPDCGGVLFQLNDIRWLRFRCLQGHAWSVKTLLQTLGTATEEAVWAAARNLTDEAALTRQLADLVKGPAETQHLLAKAAQLAEQGQALRSLLAERQQDAV